MSDDPWLTVIDQADIEAAVQRKKSRDSRLVEQEAEIAAKDARIAKLTRLVEIMIEVDPNDMAADAVTVLDVWREEARAALGGKNER